MRPLDRSRRQEQHPDTRRDKNAASQARDPTPEGGKFLEKHEHRQGGNPQDVHYPADKQQRHEHPAAADAIRSMLKPEQKASRHMVAKAAVAHQKLKRRLTLG
jgi:hypothetical protein